MLKDFNIFNEGDESCTIVNLFVSLSSRRSNIFTSDRQHYML